MGLGQQLENAIADTPERETETRRQINYVLQQYEQQTSIQANTSSSSSSLSSSLSDDGFEEDEESNDEDIDIEDEVDSQDPVVAEKGELSGSDLLCAAYMIQDEDEPDIEEAIEATNDTCEEVNESHLQETDMGTNCGEGVNTMSAKKQVELETEVYVRPDRNRESETNKAEEDEGHGNENENENEEEGEEEGSPRQPCSFFIRNSPPLPSLAQPNIKEFSDFSTSDDTASLNKQHIVNSPARQQSDSDEGVVLIMDKDASEQSNKQQSKAQNSPSDSKKPETLRKSQISGRTRLQKRFNNRRGSTNSSSSSSTGSAKSNRQNSAKNGLRKGGEDNLKNAVELPKIEQASVNNNNSSNSCSPKQQVMKKRPVVENNPSPLLTRVAVAMPLLPPLPDATIEQSTSIDLKNTNSTEGFTTAGMDAFIKTPMETTMWTSVNGEEKISVSMTEERLECLLVTPPSPRKRWKKLSPLANGSTASASSSLAPQASTMPDSCILLGTTSTSLQ